MADQGVTTSAPVHIITDKEAKANWRTNHDLHVLLLMKKAKLTKAEAVVQAYAEGVDGLNKRLG